ncbi:MAG: GUN4 domain-containing protein [Trichocoleus desertorum ATA4-8-CV12]|jgi:serine/threonine protein kinase|nr:GUN4 domain-containing protein [Trichocoleus desertorum ATA4-8-CV12]
MSYCLNPDCQRPSNPTVAQFCQHCGSRLLLRERYRPLQPLGRGGFGRTFLAVDEDLPFQPFCVVKQLHVPIHTGSLTKAVELFHQEAVRLQELGTYPQIPRLLAHFEQEQRLYLVQAWIRGQTLAQELQEQGRFSESKIWELLQDLLPVLKFIHQHQVIHRDIKPANIMRYRPNLPLTMGLQPPEAETEPVARSLVESLSDRKLVLIDFGVAKSLAGNNLTCAGTIIGSPEYMPPEQTKGKVVPASDLYSLGVTCIHLLTQVPALDMFDIAENSWAWRDFLPKGRRVSDRLGQILDKLLQEAINQRYQSADEVLQAINTNQLIATSARSPIQQAQLISSQVRSPAVAPVHVLRQGLSATGVDYTKLRDLLAAAHWQAADQETWAVLCQALGKPLGRYLLPGDISKLPCEDIQIIDGLWTKHSQKRFGWTVQTQIYQSVESDYGSFCQRIGWPLHNSAPIYSNLKFNRSAPVGHLPSRVWVGGSYWWRHAEAIATKLAECSIHSVKKSGINQF